MPSKELLRTDEKKPGSASAHPPKPHPKKHAPGHDKKHDDPAGKKKGAGKHLRRSYEHLARVDALLGIADADTKLVRHAKLVRKLAIEQLGSENGNEAKKAAAELARAAEHIAFAAAVQHTAKRLPWGAELTAAYDHEYAELKEEAEDAEDVQPNVTNLIHLLLREAGNSRDEENFARSLECMRGAESLAAAARHLHHLSEGLQKA